MIPGVTRARPWLLSLLFSFLPSIVVAQDGERDIHFSLGMGFSSLSTTDKWEYTSDYIEINGYAERPEVRILDAITVEWRQPELDSLGNLCKIRGQLRIAHKGRDQTKPVDWFQGVTVYMAMQSDVRPDWSNGIDLEDTLGGMAVVDTSGTFAVSIDLRKAQQDRKLEQSFQFGLALAKHTDRGNNDQRVFWSSRTPTIPSAIQMLDVPVAPQLSHEMELINRASLWPSSNSNGVELIRAVNALKPLGKEKALLTLEDYVRRVENFPYRGDPEIVFWIIRLLFEPVRLDDRIPSPGIGRSVTYRDSDDASLWPLDPIELVEDIPFMVGSSAGGSTGLPEHPSSHIQWARRHCIVRDEPLSPTKDPLAAAEALLRSRKFPEQPYILRLRIRVQAMDMVKDILEPVPFILLAEDHHWQARLREADELEITWVEQKQRFVARGK